MTRCARRRGLFRARLLVSLLAVSVGLWASMDLAAPAPAAAARIDQALAGGGPQPPAELNLVAGATLDGLYPLYIRNTTGAPLPVRVTERVPSGITVAPKVRDVTVAPGASASIPYKLRIDPKLAAGKYSVEIAVMPSDLSVTQGSVQFLPAVTQRFVVVVGGTAGSLKARALDTLENKQVSGAFLASRIEGVTRVPVARADGQGLDARLVPGDYDVAFELDGRTISSKQVKVSDGKTTEAELNVSLLQFTQVDASRIDANGSIAAIALMARFDNALRPLADASVTLEVRRNGKKIDDLTIQQFQTLAKGSGSVSTRYVPRTGWTDGKYEFRFRLIAENLTVVSAAQPSVQVGAVPGAGFPWLWAAGFATLVLVALVALTALVRRRRPGGRPGRIDPLAGRRIWRTALTLGGSKEPGERVAARAGSTNDEAVPGEGS